MKITDDPSLLVDQITTDADIIYYKYILSADDIQQTIDTISNIFTFADYRIKVHKKPSIDK